MRTKIVLAVAILIPLVAPSSRADDVHALLAQCRTALGKGQAIMVTLERRRGTWQIIAAPSLWDPERLAAIGTIEEIILLDKDKVTAEGCCKLAKLGKLRRLDLSNIPLNEMQLAYLRPLNVVGELDLWLDLPPSARDAALQELRWLPNVRSLKIFGISAAVVSALRDLPHLEHLETGVSQDSGGKVELSVLRGLKWLTIRSVDRSQAPLRLPAGLRRLGLETDCVVNLDLASAAGVESVDVEVSPPSGADPELQSVREGKNLKWLRRFPKLRELTVTRGDPQKIEEIAKLTTLRDLAFCTSCGSPPREHYLKPLSALRELRSLTIGVAVTEAEMRVLRDLPNLRRLAGVDFSAETANSLCELKQLDSLWLYLHDSRDAAGSVVAAVKTLPALEDLSLQGTVTDGELAVLRGLKNLRKLHLSFTTGGITEASLASLLRAMPHLEQLKCVVDYRRPAKSKRGDPFQ